MFSMAFCHIKLHNKGKGMFSKGRKRSEIWSARILGKPTAARKFGNRYSL